MPRLLALALRDTPEAVYNLEVQGAHVYHVSRGGILVHNGGGQGEVVATKQAIQAYQGKYVAYVLTTADGKIYYSGRAQVIKSPNSPGSAKWGLAARAADHMKQGADGDYQRFQPNGPNGDKMMVVVGDERFPERLQYVPVDPWGKQELPQGALRDWEGVRRVEHDQMIRNKTYIGERKDMDRSGEMVDNFRGNRTNTMAPHKADEYYKGVDRTYPHLPIEDNGKRPKPQLPKNQRPENLGEPKGFKGWEPQGGMRPDC
jgi:hypothetical protein